MNDLKLAFKEMPEVQRLQELEHIIDANPILKDLMENLKFIQKQMVNAKEFHQEKQYLEFKKQYDALYEKIIDFPFVEEYLELLEETYLILKNTVSIIQSKIDSQIID